MHVFLHHEGKDAGDQLSWDAVAPNSDQIVARACHLNRWFGIVDTLLDGIAGHHSRSISGVAGISRVESCRIYESLRPVSRLGTADGTFGLALVVTERPPSGVAARRYDIESLSSRLQEHVESERESEVTRLLIKDAYEPQTHYCLGIYQQVYKSSYLLYALNMKTNDCPSTKQMNKKSLK